MRRGFSVPRLRAAIAADRVHYQSDLLLNLTRYTREEVEALASESYKADDLGAAISSGSFETSGMIVAPCSAKSLAAIAHGYRLDECIVIPPGWTQARCC